MPGEYERYPGEIFSGCDIIQININNYDPNDYYFSSGGKIALVEDYSYGWIKELDLSKFDHVVVFTKEWTDNKSWLDTLPARYQNDNILLVTGCLYPNERHLMVPWMLLDIGPPVNHYEPPRSNKKSKKFDVLLGYSKHHRDFIFQQLKDIWYYCNIALCIIACIKCIVL